MRTLRRQREALRLESRQDAKGRRRDPVVQGQRQPRPENPDDPLLVVGRDAEDFRVDSFAVSYGDPQTVAVWAERDLLAKLMVYRVNGDRCVRSSP